jgi:hypothetical protein
MPGPVPTARVAVRDQCDRPEFTGQIRAFLWEFLFTGRLSPSNSVIPQGSLAFTSQQLTNWHIGFRKPGAERYFKIRAQDAGYERSIPYGQIGISAGLGDSENWVWVLRRFSIS